MSKDWVFDISQMQGKYGTRQWIKDNPDKLKEFLKFRINFLYEELSETKLAYDNNDSEELVDGLIDVMNTNDSFLGPINLGNDYELSVFMLAQEIIKITKSHSKITFLEALSDDPIQRRPELSLAKKIINWSSLIDLEEGLEKTSLYFKNKYFQFKLYLTPIFTYAALPKSPIVVKERMPVPYKDNFLVLFRYIPISPFIILSVPEAPEDQ